MRLGIDFGGTKIEGAVLDLDGHIVARRRVRTHRGDYGESIAQVSNLVTGLAAQVGTISSVGVGIPGALSKQTGLVKNANSTWLIGKDFRGDLESALNCPVNMANDANCFALSEAVDGAASHCTVVFGAILGTGTGAGITINSKVLAGLNAIAGEWGHNPLPWPRDEELPGPSCYCGKYGCLETYLSGPGFAGHHQAATGIALKPKEIITKMRQGDGPAHDSFQIYVDRLARGLAHVINIVDPDIIVLGGGMSNIDEIYTNLPEALSRYVFSDSCLTPVVAAKHGDAGGVRGAAWL